MQRDVVRLPLRYFPSSAEDAHGRRATLLPDMEPYLMVRGTRDDEDDGVIVSDGTRLALPPGISRIEVDLPRGAMWRLGGKGNELVAFCAYTVEGERVLLRKPDDPLAGCVLLPGDPEDLSRESERAARRAELVSVLFVALNAFMNLPLVFLLLSLVIR